MVPNCGEIYRRRAEAQAEHAAGQEASGALWEQGGVVHHYRVM